MENFKKKTIRTDNMNILTEIDHTTIGVKDMELNSKRAAEEQTLQHKLQQSRRDSAVRSTGE